MRPEGFKAQIRYILQNTIADAVAAIIARLYATSTAKKQRPDYRQRNQRIRELYASGMTQAEIGAMVGISGRRVSYIVNKKQMRK
jgi:DNA-directed RNA polymerase specialized sigma subunit